MTELITARPDVPMGEEWQWQTDVITSRNGTEQRIDNSSIPRRQISGNYAIHDQALINQFAMAMARAKGEGVHAAFFQYETKLTAAAALGATNLAFNARGTELRSGDLALLYDDNDLAYELVQIGVLSPLSATLSAPTTLAWPAGSLIAPVHLVYGGSGLVINRHRVDALASIDLTLREMGFHDPFLNPYNTTTLDLYAGIPVIIDKPIGDAFDEEILTGAQIIDFGGIVDIDSQWTRTKDQYLRRWHCRRIMVPAEFEKWMVFGSTIRGAQKPFWLPSYRADYTIISPPAPSGNQMTLGGHFFRDYCFPYAGRKSFFIESDGGLHLATATAQANSGANDLVTFAPALPAGAAYGLNQKIGILHRCRLADSKMSWQHFNAHSILEMGIISTDQ